MTERQVRRREATRREVLAAAWEVAREKGLASLTLREVGDLVGMRAASLYSHFDSKNAIYDAMYEQAWAEFLAHVTEVERTAPTEQRALLKLILHTFFDFAVADLARYQLMNQRTIPGFVPTERAYAPAVAAFETMRRVLGRIGVRADADIDLWTALCGGLVDQHLANDPGGSRWRGQIDRSADMFANEVGMPR